MTFFPDGGPNVVLVGPGAEAGMPERAWHLSLPRSENEGVALASGWADWDEPDETHQWVRGVRESGATWLGAVGETSKFDLPVYVTRTGDSGSRRSVQAAFREDIRYDKTSRLYVIDQRTGYRWVDLRQDGKVKNNYEFLDDADDDAFLMTVPVVVDKPDWTGIASVEAWANGQPTAGRRLRQEGDREGWYTAVIKGPGIFRLPDGDGKLITFPELHVNEIATIKTHPDQRTIKSSEGRNLFKELGAQRFRSSIPESTEQQVSYLDLSGLSCIGGTSESSVVFTLEPKFRRPW